MLRSRWGEPAPAWTPWGTTAAATYHWNQPGSAQNVCAGTSSGNITSVSNPGNRVTNANYPVTGASGPYHLSMTSAAVNTGNWADDMYTPAYSGCTTISGNITAQTYALVRWNATTPQWKMMLYDHDPSG